VNETRHALIEDRGLQLNPEEVGIMGVKRWIQVAFDSGQVHPVVFEPRVITHNHHRQKREAENETKIATARIRQILQILAPSNLFAELDIMAQRQSSIRAIRGLPAPAILKSILSSPQMRRSASGDAKLLDETGDLLGRALLVLTGS
jgi:hypothetical protein